MGGGGLRAARRSCARWAGSASSRCGCPRRWAASGLDARASVVLAEEVGRSTHGGFAITVLVHTDMASPHLIRFGTRRQLEKYLPGVMAGTTITAVGVTEPGAGSDVAAIRTRAVRDGDHYVLNGAKMFITNGVHGDLYFIAARTDPEAKGVARHHHVHRREGHAGLPRRPRARQDRLAQLRHRRAGVRGLPRAGRERAGRAQSRLLLDHGQLPDRAAGDRRHGDGRGARGDPAHLRLRQPAHRVRRAAVGEADDPPAPVAPAGRGRGGAPARASHGVARRRRAPTAWRRSRWSRRWPATW